MQIEKTPIDGLLLISPDVFADHRGCFLEAMNICKLSEVIPGFQPIQENQAYSRKGVIRGMHFQRPPFAHGKLVRAIQGEILDVAIDLRSGSPTFGQHYKVILTDQNQYQLWIPIGFAHGALTVSETSIMAYYSTALYSKEHSVSIRFDDPDLGIDWGLDHIVLTETDRHASLLKEINTGFIYHSEEG
jgi:dTDP-4-dehydrorhamnose 3,5-epimerase